MMSWSGPATTAVCAGTCATDRPLGGFYGNGTTGEGSSHSYASLVPGALAHVALEAAAYQQALHPDRPRPAAPELRALVLDLPSLQRTLCAPRLVDGASAGERPADNRIDVCAVGSLPARHALPRLSGSYAHHRLHMALGADLVARGVHAGPARHPAFRRPRLRRAGDAADHRQPRGGRDAAGERRHSPFGATRQCRAPPRHHFRRGRARRAAACCVAPHL